MGLPFGKYISEQWRQWFSAHAHTGSDGSAAVSTAVADTSITNAKLATDVKVGSLAALTTTQKASLVGAINEVDANADSAAGVAATAVQGDGVADIIRTTVTLGGANPTHVNLAGADVAATLLGTVAGPYAITAGQTFVVNANAAGDVTATFAGAQGKSTSGASPSTDTSASLDTKFGILVNGDVGGVRTVTCDWTAGGGTNDGTKIAAEMQTKIQALGGVYAAVTVDYNVTTASKYVIKSGTYGTGSSVVVTPATSGSITEELKIGVADGGVEAAGTGDAVNLAATAASEVATKLAALAGLTATVAGTAVRITSDVAGSASSLVVNAGCALDTVFGITGTDYGEEGGAKGAMADANYSVFVQNLTTGDTNTYSILNRTTSGFDLQCETAGSTNSVDVLVFGTKP
jgi:flagellin